MQTTRTSLPITKNQQNVLQNVSKGFKRCLQKDVQKDFQKDSEGAMQGVMYLNQNQLKGLAPLEAQ